MTRKSFIELAGAIFGISFAQGCSTKGTSNATPQKSSLVGSHAAAMVGRLPISPQPFINVLVGPDISPVTQPTNRVCWAAVWTMIFSWKEGKSFTIKDAVSRLGSEWVGHLERDEGLTAQTFTEEGFLSASGLQAKPPANYLSSAYVGYLASHGPLWINTGDGILNHATLMCGAQTRRDGRIDFLFIDPIKGNFVVKSDRDFFVEFEREAVAIVARKLKWDFRYQIFHW